MELLIFWLLGSLIVGIIAGSRGRNGFGYFMLSVMLSPLLIGILVLAIGRPAPNPSLQKKCPQCAEFVLREAIKCKHCGSELQPLR